MHNAFYILQRLMPEVGVVELGIVTARGQQRLVGAFFQDASVVKDEDAVGVLHRVQAVRDDDRTCDRA